MKYRYLDLSELAYSHQFLLPAILAALPIPEDYEHIEKIEHLLKPVPEDPNERKSLEQIQKEFEKKIDKISETYVGRHRHYQELSNCRSKEFEKKQNRAFENLRIYGTTGAIGIWGGITLTGSAVLNSGAPSGSIAQNLKHGPSWVAPDSVHLKPRNWFARQIVNLLFDMKKA